MHDVRRHLSRTEYLEQSLMWEQKHEWINGEIYAMSGGSFLHNAICVNVSAALLSALDGRPSRPTSSDQRVFVTASGASLYPDVSVICGPFLAAPDDPQAVTNPTLIVEVLSPSTRSYDLGAKLEHYLLIDTVEHVLLVEAEQRHCILHTRTAEGWYRRDIHTGAVGLGALDVVLSIDTIYADLAQLGH